MRKITLLLSFIACVGFMQAQTNLLVNPSFETWADGKPTGWAVPVTPSHASAITVTQEQTIVSNGASSFKVVTDNSQNPAYQQVVPVTVGKTYTISIDYYIVAGDGSDARIWSNFKNGATFLSDTQLGTTLVNALKGPGGTSSYFPDVKGSWQTYTVDVVAPSDVTDFAFEVRSYKNSTVIFDNMFFGEKITSTKEVSSDVLNIKLSGKKLTVLNAATSSVEIYTVLGAKVATLELHNGSTELNLSKGLYVVRAGKKVAKIML